MKTRALMIASALFLGLCGLAASFLPQEILTWARVPEMPFAVVLVQTLGAVYLGFAFLNWTAKGVLLGGIYARPVALGNFFHFAVVTVVLVKTIPGGGPSPVLLVAAVSYALFAAWFGLVLFGDPLSKRSAASGSARPGSGTSRT